jgi:hypothetical protein
MLYLINFHDKWMELTLFLSEKNIVLLIIRKDLNMLRQKFHTLFLIVYCFFNAYSKTDIPFTKQFCIILFPTFHSWCVFSVSGAIKHFEAIKPFILCFQVLLLQIFEPFDWRLCKSRYFNSKRARRKSLCSLLQCWALTLHLKALLPLHPKVDIMLFVI